MGRTKNRFLRRWWDTWVNKRFNYSSTRNLKQNDVFVFFHPQGYVFGVLILITFIAGINYANNLILGLCFLLSAILCMSFYMAFRQLYQLKISISLPEVAQLGKSNHLVIQIEQDAKKPLISRMLRLSDAEQEQIVLSKTALTRVNWALNVSERGAFSVKRIKLSSRFPFGLVQAWSYIHIPTCIWVAPQGVLPQHLHHLGHALIDIPRPDDLKELKSYQLGDPLTQVSWKHVAQGKGFFVKTFEALDEDKFHIDYDDFKQIDHEKRLQFIMGLAEKCKEAQRPFSIKIKDISLAAGTDQAHFLQTQLILAQQPK